MDDNLKCCPFCGGKAKLINTGFGMSTFYAMCVNEKCCVSPATRYYYEEKDAAEAWNKRSGITTEQIYSPTIYPQIAAIDKLIMSQQENLTQIDAILDRIYEKLSKIKEEKNE